MAHQWIMTEKTPTELQYDLSRSVRLPCHESDAPPSKAVCVVSRRTVSGTVWNMAVQGQIGHQAQFLFKCWSFFQEHPNAKRIMVDSIQHRGFSNRSVWASKMARALHIEFALSIPKSCAVLWGAPTRNGVPGVGENWFPTPHAAWAMTAQVMRTGFSSSAGLLPGERRRAFGDVNVGVLRRASSRQWKATADERGRDWTQHEQFVRSVQSRPIQGVANASNFMLGNSLSLAQQAEEVRQYDIIITPHGSQSVGLAFIRPCTVVIEVLAAKYLVAMFSDLAIDAGGRSLMLVHGAPSVLAAAAMTMNTFRGNSQRLNQARNAGSFDSLGVETVRDAVATALSIRQRCLAGDNRTAFDGVPTLGGFHDARASWLNVSLRGAADHCFHCTARDAACCSSVEAHAAYYHEGAYACGHCMATFRAQSLPAECQQGACRLPDMVATAPAVAGPRAGASVPTVPPGRRQLRSSERSKAAVGAAAAAPPRDVTVAEIARDLAAYDRSYPARRKQWQACSAAKVETQLAAAARAFPNNASAHASAFLEACRSGPSLDIKQFTSFDAMGFFNATWRPEPHACARLVRLGPGIAKEGGKTLCLDGDALQDPRCFIMSVGINGDTRFEEALHAYAPQCEIVGMDGTLNQEKLSHAAQLSFMRFVPQNFRAAIAATYAGKRASLLKIDCEACEYTTIAPWLDTVCTDQVAVEVHHIILRRPLQRVLSQHNLFLKLDRTHRLVAMEANRKYPTAAVEYTWLRRQPCP